MRWLYLIMGLLSGLFFGLSTPASKKLLMELNPFQLAGLLYLGASVSSLPFLFKNHKREFAGVRDLKSLKYIIGVIVFGGLAGPVLLMIGLKQANAASVAIWLNMELVATAVLGFVVFKDRLDIHSWVGVLVTLLAGVVMASQQSSAGIVAGIFVVLACICWGLDNHLTALIDAISPQTITFIKGLFAGLTNLIIGIIVAGSGVSIKYILIAILLGLVSYGISINLYVLSAQNLGATRSQLLFSTGPFWGVLFAVLFLNEPFEKYTALSLVLLGVGVLLSVHIRHGHTHHHKQITHIHFHTHKDQHHQHQHESENINDRDIGHIHLHTHDDLNHSHPHYPDLHHRHDHQ